MTDPRSVFEVVCPNCGHHFSLTGQGEGDVAASLEKGHAVYHCPSCKAEISPPDFTPAG